MKYFFLFALAFLLNVLWEFWHAQFYLHYQGGAITSMVLFRAALVDAMIITVIAFVAQRFFYQQRFMIMIFLGIAIAIVIEWWALGSGRWAYANTMPLIPLFGSGLTPTIQLSFLGYISLRYSEFLYKRRK